MDVDFLLPTMEEGPFAKLELWAHVLEYTSPHDIISFTQVRLPPD